MRALDLHTHSRYSDGTSAPADVVRRAHAQGVEVLALSDHDSVSGFEEASREGARLGVMVLCGVEINTSEAEQLHILGYGLDCKSGLLETRLEEFRSRRVRRVQAIVEKLQRQAGFDISWEEIRGTSLQAVGRPHVADALIRKGLARSRREAFEKYLVFGRVGYVAPMGPSPAEAIAAIREAGGWACLAHPGTMDFERDLGGLVDVGLSGVEVYYPSHGDQTVVRLLQLAQDHGLMPTGGSDYHGPGTGRDRIGSVRMPQEAVLRLLDRLGVCA